MLDLVAQNLTRVDLETKLKSLKLSYVDTTNKTHHIDSRHSALAFLEGNSPYPRGELLFIDVCPKDCILFRKQNSEAVVCPKCGEPRFDDEGNAVRVYPYLPLIPRIKRYYASRNWSLMFENVFNREFKDGEISDVLDGTIYRTVCRQKGSSKYHLPFFMGCDGITMDAKQKLSVEPVALVNCFVLPELRTKSSYTILGGLIPPNSSNMEVFLEPLLEEFTTPFDVWDALDNCVHPCYPLLLFGVFDLKAFPKATCGQPAPAYYVCHECDFKGRRNVAGHTTCYCGHYVFLPPEMLQLRQMCHDVLPATDAKPAISALPPAKRSKESSLAAGKLSEESKLGWDNPNHPRKRFYYYKPCYFSKHLDYWHPRNSFCYEALHIFLNKGRDWCKIHLGLKDSAGLRDQFEQRFGVSADSFLLSPEEINFVNSSCKNTVLCRSFGSSLRPFLIPKHVNWLKGHD